MFTAAALRRQILRWVNYKVDAVGFDFELWIRQIVD